MIAISVFLVKFFTFAKKIKYSLPNDHNYTVYHNISKTIVFCNKYIICQYFTQNLGINLSSTKKMCGKTLCACEHMNTVRFVYSILEG